MRNSLVAAYLVGAASCAFAQSVVVHGLVDVAVEHVTNVGPSGSSLERIASATGSLPSRIGFRGSEDLGDQLRTLFVLEQGFAPSSGTPAQGETRARPSTAT